MHKDLDISIDKMSKIEGRGTLEIKVRNNEVKKVKLKITENKRFYTQAIRGKACTNVPQLVSRICGTCGIAHLTCCTEAVEKALNIIPTEQTIVLRKLAMYGLMIRDHAMHLYFFVLPDIVGKDSVLDFDESQEDMIRQAFRVKGTGNTLSKTIAGSAVHSTYSQIGYFSHIPNEEDKKRAIAELKNAREDVIALIDIFYKCDFTYKRDTNFVALITKDYSFLEGEIRSSDGTIIPEEDYWNYLNRVVIPYSQATGFEFKGREYMVGALARMNMNRNNLHKDTIRDTKKQLNIFPSNNVYHNNLAQAIEILHCIDHSIELLETIEFKEEPKPEIKIRAGDGVGVIEAPRGTLYYMLSLDESGRIKYGNLVIPTAQNQIMMEKDIRGMLPGLLNKPKKEIVHEIEKLIRAYDPCMSCASHFLKVKWT